MNLTADDLAWVEPDVGVACNSGKLSDRGCGYRIVDPGVQLATACRLEAEGGVLRRAPFGEPVASGVFDGFAITVAGLLA